MTSVSKREANKRNAQRSTGPRDTRKSRYNAVRHGMSAGFLSKEAIIDGGPGREDPEELEEIRKGLWDAWAPEGVPEELLVDQLAMLTWRWRRIVRHEAAAIHDSQERAVAQGRGLVHGDEMDEDDAETTDEKSEELVGDIDVDLAAMQTSDPLAYRPHLGVLALGEAESAYKVSIEKLLSLRKDWDEYEELSLTQMRKVIRAACQKAEISEQDFWAGIRQPLQHDLDIMTKEPDLSWVHIALGRNSGAPAPEGRSEEAEKRQQRIPSLPSSKVLEKVQRHESHLSRLNDRALRQLVTLQAVRRQRSELNPDDRRRARSDDGGSAWRPRRGGAAL